MSPRSKCIEPQTRLRWNFKLARRADAEPSRAAPPSLHAAFVATSYAPGQLAALRVLGKVRVLELQILRAGAERKWSSVGRPWGPALRLRFRSGSENVVRRFPPFQAFQKYLVSETSVGNISRQEST